MLTIVDLSPRFSVLFCFHRSTTSAISSIRSGDAGTAPDVTTFAAGCCRAPWAVAAEQLQMLRQQGLKQDVTRRDGRMARRKLGFSHMIQYDSTSKNRDGILHSLLNQQWGFVPFRRFCELALAKGKSTISGCESNKFFDVRMARTSTNTHRWMVELPELHLYFGHRWVLYRILAPHQWESLILTIQIGHDQLLTNVKIHG